MWTVFMRLILASESPRRRTLLESLGMDFDVIPSNVDETFRNLRPREAVRSLSVRKATAVATKLNDGLVVAGDTLIDFSGAAIGKPRDKEDAFETLKALSDNDHTVITAVALVDSRTERLEVGDVEATVRMRELSDAEIRAYVATGEPLGKAGSYAIQGQGRRLIASFTGREDTIIGFPVDLFLNLLDRMTHD
jgi:septum formation protein